MLFFVHGKAKPRYIANAWYVVAFCCVLSLTGMNICFDGLLEKTLFITIKEVNLVLLPCRTNRLYISSIPQ